MKNECMNCKKKYRTKNIVTFLCPVCTEKAKNETDDSSMLKIYYFMQNLGIVSIN